MTKGDKIKLIRPIDSVIPVGEICEITNITEEGDIWFRFRGSYFGCIFYDDLDRYFQKYVNDVKYVDNSLSDNSRIKISIEWNFVTDGDYMFQKSTDGYDYGIMEDGYQYQGHLYFIDYVKARSFLEEMLCNAKVSPSHHYLLKKFYDIFDSLICFVNSKSTGQCREDICGNYDGTFIEVITFKEKNTVLT